MLQNLMELIGSSKHQAWCLQKIGEGEIQFKKIAMRLSMTDLTLQRYHHKGTTVLQHKKK